MGYLPPPPPWAPPFAWQEYYTEVQKRDIRRLSNIHGGGLLLAVALQVAVIAPLANALPDFFPALAADPLWSLLLQMATTVLTIFPGALLCLRLLTPWEHNRALPLGKPFAAAAPNRRRTLTLAVLCLGLFVCFAGQLVSSWVETFFNQFDLSLRLPDDDVVAGGSSPALFLFRLLVIALCPAVIEELLMRGAVLQPLRRYGDVFAVVFSSLLFALLHGNLLQGVFAFFAGLAMGFAAVYSGSLWPGIVLHFLNNGFAVVLDELFTRYPESDRVAQITNLSYLAFHVGVGVLGLALILLCRRSLPKLRKPNLLVSGRTLTVNYLFASAPMALALLVFLGEIVLMAVLGNIT
ncbi:MAG: CPBP family intramembrane metalloprotease [Oscillospiraceae bacterium]|jgi:membrane protease YdiL (CAAX protease family)|nr:CPBP family intramembrane metalloprotease [Oscillospiraceae bacterium]